MEMIHFAGRSAGKVYWGLESSSVLVLDESTLKFSLLAFPAPMQWPYRRTSFRVIGGVDGGDTMRVVCMDGQDLKVFGQLLDSDERVGDRDEHQSEGRDRKTGRLAMLVLSAAGEDCHCRQYVRGTHATRENLALLRGSGDHGGEKRARQEPACRAIVPVRAAMASCSASLRKSWRHYW
jgi:hypothetical protein